MRSVPIAVFKDKVSEFIAEAQAGEEVVITRHGKPAAKLVAIEDDKRAMHREAIKGLAAIGREVFARHGPTKASEIRKWIEEDRNRH
jgi:prevent-host-death family protein